MKLKYGTKIKLLPLLLAGPVFFILAVIGISQVSAQVAAGPEQPIKFSHALHAGSLGVQCTFCHRNAESGSAATVPAVEQCMFCHSVIAKGRPEVEKVRAAFAEQKPIDWVRVYRVPDHVKFVHEPHIRIGFQCATCHGQVEQMIQVNQFRPLNMGDCVTCHRQNNAPTDCATCHN